MPEHFINRELSWLEFNARVLEEAEDAGTPLLERVKFLAIFSSNLDEFFMVRVAGLREQAFEEGVPQDFNPDGMRASVQLDRVATRIRELIESQYKCWRESVLPQLAKKRHSGAAAGGIEQGTVQGGGRVLSPDGVSDPDADGRRSEPSAAALSQPVAVRRRDAETEKRPGSEAAVRGGAASAGFAATGAGRA